MGFVKSYEGLSGDFSGRDMIDDCYLRTSGTTHRMAKKVIPSE
jgi:hypothetical protein